MLSDSLARPSTALHTILPEEHAQAADPLLRALLLIHTARQTHGHGIKLPDGPAREFGLQVIKADQPTPFLQTLRNIVELYVWGPNRHGEDCIHLAEACMDVEALDAELDHRGLSQLEKRDVLPWTRYLPQALEPLGPVPAPYCSA